MKYILLLSLFFFIKTSSGQDIYKRYPADSSDVNRIHGIFPVDDGFVLVGNFHYTSDTIPNYTLDVFAMKINLMGEVLWSKIFHGSKEDNAGSIGAVDSTGYIFLASTKSSDGIFDNLILKLNQNGDTIWTKVYGSNKDGDFNGRNNNLEVLPDGSFIISSMTWSVGQGHADAHIVRFSKDGIPIWARTIGGTENERIQDGGIIRQDSFIYVLGTTQSTEFTLLVRDAMVIKMNLNGDTLWTKGYGDWSSEGLNNISKADSSNFLLIGKTLSNPDPAKYDGYFIKINSNGDTVWTRSMATPGHVYLHHSFTTPHGHYLVGHNADGFVPGKENGFITKISLEGKHLWTRRINDDDHSIIFRLHIDALGNLFLFGYQGANFNSFMIKTDTTSAMGKCYFKDALPTFRSTGTQVFDMHPMVIDTILPISSIPIQVGSGLMAKDFCTDTTSIEEVKREEMLFYPNPFSTQLNFNFPEITNQKITVEIIEIATGRIILKEIFNSFNGVLSINDIASGIYLARVSDGKKVLYNGKLVCIKQ